VLFLGDDWAEAHHDVELQDEHGRVLARRRLPEGVSGLAQLHAVLGAHLEEDAEPASVVVGIETDRGGWVQALVATGYVVYALNPLQVARYRERHTTSGAKSDPGDAHVLAEIVRVDRGHHRPVAGDSDQAEVIKTVVREMLSQVEVEEMAASYPGRRELLVVALICGVLVISGLILVSDGHLALGILAAVLLLPTSVGGVIWVRRSDRSQVRGVPPETP
jgi:transposase